jgi:LCP family protein required for cell wall assembly
MTNSSKPPVDPQLLLGDGDVRDDGAAVDLDLIDDASVALPAAELPPQSARVPRPRLRAARWGQLSGLLLALAGLLVVWLTQDVERSTLTDAQRALIGLAPGESYVGFVVAGLDRLYFPDMSTPVYNADGDIVAWNYRGPRGLDGVNTDTILYVSMRGSAATLIAIPRDTYVPSFNLRINVIYHLYGIEGLKEAVASLVGLPVDYYAIINLDVFENAVDALGGVEVNVPYRMRYVDVAGGLNINLQPGAQRLDGQQAADFVRFRETIRGDYDRIDRIKTLAFAMLQRLRDLNIRAVGMLPELVETLTVDIDTNTSAALLLELLPRLGELQLQAATLPTFEAEGSSRLYVDPVVVEAFLASTFGGVGRQLSEPPSVTLQIVNRSERPGLGDAYRDTLLQLGVPESQLLSSEAAPDPAGTRLMVVAEHWEEADYYAELIGVGKQQIDRLPSVAGRVVGMQLILGSDAGVPLGYTLERAQQDAAVEMPGGEQRSDP